MAQTKRKAVFTAEPTQLEQIEAMVQSGEYRSASEFLREAIDDKLRALREKRLERQVADFCREGLAEEDGDLIGFQAFDRDDE